MLVLLHIFMSIMCWVASIQGSSGKKNGTFPRYEHSTMPCRKLSIRGSEKTLKVSSVCIMLLLMVCIVTMEIILFIIKWRAAMSPVKWIYIDTGQSWNVVILFLPSAFMGNWLKKTFHLVERCSAFVYLPAPWGNLFLIIKRSLT